MKRNKCVYQLAAAAALAASSSALAQLRIGTWNIAADTNGNTSVNPGTDVAFYGMGTETVNGFARPLDILAIQEPTTNALTVTPFVSTLNAHYSPSQAVYATTSGGTVINGSGQTVSLKTFQATSNGSLDGNGPNSLIYNVNTLQLVDAVGIGSASSSGPPRQITRYQFRPIGYGASADFYVYSEHYKAGDPGTPDRRLIEAQAVRANAGTLPAGSRLLYMGDFNLTGGSTEDAWTTLTTNGTFTNGSTTRGVDPLGLASFSGGSSAQVGYYTESTGKGSGSLSIRFDFQTNTPATTDAHGFSIISNSYHVFGNNGTTPLHKKVTDPANTALNSTLRSALVTASDHYPVIADYRLPAKMGVSIAPVPAQVIVGASLPVGVTVTNAAPVQIAIGADGLDYTVSSSGSLSGSANVTGLAALAPGNLHNLTMNTAAVGTKTGTITFGSTSQEVAGVPSAQVVSTTVLAHAHPSFTTPTQTTMLAIDFGTRAANSAVLSLGTPQANFSIRDLADVSGFSSALDLDSTVGSGNTSALTTNLAPTTIAAGGAQGFSANLSTANYGSFSATYTLNLSDQDLPGAQATAPLTLTLTGRIALAGDANIDGVVNALDFNALATHFGQSSQNWNGADFNADGIVNTVDFAALAQNFGSSYNPNPASALGAVIPEPAAFAVSCLGILICRRKNRRNPLFRLN